MSGLTDLDALILLRLMEALWFLHDGYLGAWVIPEPLVPMARAITAAGAQP